MKQTIINARGITLKSENGIILHKSSFSIYQGEILAFCQTSQMPSFLLMLFRHPENCCEGTVTYMGQPIGRRNPVDFSYVAGSDSLIEALSIVDNLYASTYPRTHLFYSPRRAEAAIQEVAQALELPFDIHQSIGELTISQKYMLELAKAILMGSQIIILDNISRNCSVDDYAWIINVLEHYSKKGQTFILLSNEDNFLLRKCDRIYFYRGTKVTDLIFSDEYSLDTFQRILYGTHDFVYKQHAGTADAATTALEITLPGELYSGKKLSVQRGELYGIFDLFGTLAEAVYNSFFTAFPYRVDGATCKNYRQAVKNGLAILSPHRKNTLFDTFSMEENLIFPALRRISKFGVINRRMERYCSNLYLPRLVRNYDSQEAELEKLKMLFYRCMLANPKVIVLDNPPLDLSEKQQVEVEKLLCYATDSGCAIVLISSNINIGLPLCDHALILRKNDYIEK